MGLVYKIKNNITGKEYVGQTTSSIEKRFDQHISRGRKISGSSLVSTSLREYGSLNHSIEILQECDNNQLRELEQEWIDKLNTLYNGLNVKNEFKEKNKSHYYGNKEKAVENLSNGLAWNTGIAMADKQRRKISNTKKKKQELGMYTNYGHPHTKTSIEKIKEAKKMYFEHGGVNSNAKVYDVYKEGSLILENATGNEIMNAINIDKRAWCTLRKYCKDTRETKEHPKHRIVVKDKGRFYDR